MAVTNRAVTATRREEGRENGSFQQEFDPTLDFHCLLINKTPKDEKNSHINK